MTRLEVWGQIRREQFETLGVHPAPHYDLDSLTDYIRSDADFIDP